MADVEPLLSVPDVCLRYPGISPRAARELMRNVGAVQIGRRLFVRRADVLAHEVALRSSRSAGRPDAVISAPPRGYWVQRGA